MSVRRETFRGSRSGGLVRGMKSALLWIAILTSCFLFGWLVVSPLINVAAGRSSGTPPTQTAAVVPGAQVNHDAPETHAPTARRDERRAPRDEKPDIQIDPDKGSSEQVQRTDSVERNPENRRDRRNRGHDENTDNQPTQTDSNESGSTSDESASNDPVNQDSAESATEERRPTTRRREPRSGQDTSSEQRRSPRRNRKNDSAPQPADQGGGVQKSENVDN